MKTYQDLVEVGENEQDRMMFVKAAVEEHKSSKLYQNALVAQSYFAGENVTINNYNKFIHDAFGRKVLDVWSPNHKIACNYYGHLVTQLALHLVGNGVSFGNDDTKEKLGGSDLDPVLLDLLLDALNDSVAFGFVNKDKVQEFTIRNFVPLYDEETGSLRAGVRWWKVAENKPARYTLFEENGYTDYIQPKNADIQILHEKRPYIQVINISDASGEEITDGMNYPTFPIVPLYNYGKRSELDRSRNAIDALDLMVSQLVNNVDAGEAVYWLFHNTGGMSQAELTQFIQTLKATHVAAVDNDGDVTTHSPDVKFEASREAIEQLRRQIFDNQMGADVRNIASGAATATQIRAAYEPLNAKADLLEMQVGKFIRGILAVIGVDDTPSFSRSGVNNQLEMIQAIVAAGSDLPQEYKTRKILEILGDIDKADEAVQQMLEEEAARYVDESAE